MLGLLKHYDDNIVLMQVEQPFLSELLMKDGASQKCL